MDGLAGKKLANAFSFGVDTLDQHVDGIPFGALVTVGADILRGVCFFSA